MAANKSKDVLCPGADGCDGQVFPLGEQARMVASAMEPTISNKKLDPTVFFAVHQLSGQLGERVRACESGSAAAGIQSVTLTLSHSLTQFLQQAVTPLVIHRASVVWIDQTEIPQL